MGILNLIIIIPLVVVTVGVGMRMFPRKIGDVRFRDTDVTYAAGIALDYAEGTYENRLGYPTGFYVFDENKSQMPQRIVLREAQPMGTVTDGCAYEASSIGAVGFDEGLGTGCITSLIAAAIATPFWIVSTLDRLYRNLLRSKVTFEFRADGADAVATLSLSGVGAYLMKPRYEKVFNPPELPESVRPWLPEPDPDEASGSEEPTA